MDRHTILSELGIEKMNSGAAWGPFIKNPSGDELPSISPIDGKEIARVKMAGERDYEEIVERAQDAFKTWRMMPAPKRGEIIRQIGLALREKKKALGALVTLEMGKIIAEGEGEVQEMIDMADFAVGLSRQLYGMTMQSERPHHRMFEQWHPLGTIGIITAFNFPVAVWSWNAMIAAVCGDTMIWKPSSKTPLTGIAVHKIANSVLEKHGLSGIMNMVVGRGPMIGEKMSSDKRLPLISATGSCKMGRAIGQNVAKRLGRSLLELGGNNAVIVSDKADLNLAIRAVLFGSVGTAGQRCTTTRRLFLQEKIAEEMKQRLVKAYEQIRIGDPLDPKTLMGPLVDTKAVKIMQEAMETIKKEGGKVIYGGNPLDLPGGCYVEPALVEASPDLPIMKEETFAPILYIVTYKDIEEAVAMHNNVDQGLSSSLFTKDVYEMEYFLSAMGSDCGIANINLGTSGAEIGGAFGGEKDTGGGREAGSDAWKNYMRRQTNTINWGKDLPLAQGIKFGDN